MEPHVVRGFGGATPRIISGFGSFRLTGFGSVASSWSGLPRASHPRRWLASRRERCEIHTLTDGGSDDTYLLTNRARLLPAV